MANNEKLLEITKDIVIAMINNDYIPNPGELSKKNNNEVIKATETIFNKLSELNEKTQNNVV